MKKFSEFIAEGKDKKIVLQGKLLAFPDGTKSSIPSWDEEDGAIWLVIAGPEGEVEVQEQNGKVYLQTDKWDKMFKNAHDLVEWLNKNGYTEFSGIDDK